MKCNFPNESSKLELSVDLLAGDEMPSLQQRIFDVYWDAVVANVPRGKHGNFSAVRLSCGNEKLSEVARVHALVTEGNTIDVTFEIPERLHIKP
ncbi:MAG: hypothetical protein S4CHLAM81_04790 [Chlamydiales bacterium]|nr:hypothetical protein [Chlamydiales bacterium]MCH9635268.1 hypothetical protein [Chlamydiales bacterium]